MKPQSVTVSPSILISVYNNGFKHKKCRGFLLVQTVTNNLWLNFQKVWPTDYPKTQKENNNAAPWSSAVQHLYHHNYNWDETIAGDTNLIFLQFLDEMSPNDGSVVQDIITWQMFLLHFHVANVGVRFATRFLASSKHEAMEIFRFVLHNVQAI